MNWTAIHIYGFVTGFLGTMIHGILGSLDIDAEWNNAFAAGYLMLAASNAFFLLSS